MSRLRYFVTVIFFAVGCAGEGPSPRDVRADSPPVASDQGADLVGPADSAVDGTSSDGTPSGCSPAGTAATCDPIAKTGCSEGQCYMVPTKGSACVCPAGTKAGGDPCNTTVECVPGFGCAGDAPPGTCRRFCSVADFTCAGGEKCVPIDTNPEVGMCMPE